MPGQTVSTSRSQRKTCSWQSLQASAWETLSFTDARAGSRYVVGGAGDHFSVSGFPVYSESGSQLSLVT